MPSWSISPPAASGKNGNSAGIFRSGNWTGTLKLFSDFKTSPSPPSGRRGEILFISPFCSTQGSAQRGDGRRPGGCLILKGHEHIPGPGSQITAPCVICTSGMDAASAHNAGATVCRQELCEAHLPLSPFILKGDGRRPG